MHLHLCPHPTLRKILLHELEVLEATLRKEDVPSDVWLLLKAGILAHVGERYQFPRKFQGGRVNALAVAFDNQTEIGWNNLLKGRIAVKWRHIMEEVYTGIRSKAISKPIMRRSDSELCNLW